jgi:hypothetical protein
MLWQLGLLTNFIAACTIIAKGRTSEGRMLQNLAASSLPFAYACF